MGEVNDLRPGFKMTEIGPLPEEWGTYKIDDLFEIQQGKALSKKHKEGKSPSYFLRTSNVYWGRLDLTTLDRMDFTDQQRRKLKLQKGDLLICEGGEIGRTAIWNNEVSDCYYQNHVYRVRASSENVDPYFYMFWMQAAITLFDLYRGRGTKTTIANLSKGRLSEFPVAHPPLPEQRAITQVLSAVRQAMEATEAVIEAAQALKKSLMQHLFTYGPVPVDQADQIPLKETEIGLVPEGWDVVRLGEVIFKAQYGANNRAGSDGKYPILRMSNLVDGSVDLSRLKYVDLGGDEFHKFELRPGDILFNRTNSYELVGKTALFDEAGDFVFASYLIRVITDPDLIRPEFLNHYLNWHVAQFRLRMLATRGVSQSNISASKLKGFLVHRPPLAAQDLIANHLSDVHEKIGAEVQRRSALEALFNSLLHHLMTGQVRVPIP